MPLYPGFPLAGSDYAVGTITLTAGSKDFTLTGSNPLDYAAAQAGDEIYVPHAAKVLLIETITNTGGTLIYPCPDDCAGVDLPFRLQLKNASSRLQGMAATLLQAIGSGNLAALDEVELQENQLLAGDAVQGTFKGIDVNDLQIDASGKLDKTGGEVTGDLSVNGALSTGTHLLVDTAGFYPNGDIWGTVWGQWGSNWAFTAISNHIAANVSTLQDDISSKLDKAGGTITGDLTINGNLKGAEWQEWGNVQAKTAISSRINAIAVAIVEDKINELVNDMIDAKINAFKNNPEFTGTLTVNGNIQATGNIEAHFEETEA